jgi:hypothetical protein
LASGDVMRKLTAKQRKILDGYNVGCVEDLPDGVMQTLEQINDTEILSQEVDRYLRDKWNGIYS